MKKWMLVMLLVGLTSGAAFSQTTSEEQARTLTLELRDNMTPEEVFQTFKDGNKRFTEGQLRYRKLTTEISETAAGQHPYAIVLSCIDSRVPVETIFDKRIGDMFSTRIAGNILNEDILGGMEFACQFAGAKLILVMGHSKCGAVQGAAAHVQFGNLTQLLNKIEPAVTRSEHSYEGKRDVNDYQYVDHIAEENVRIVKEQIRERSPALRQLEKEGKIKIAGCFYEIETGIVRFHD